MIDSSKAKAVVGAMFKWWYDSPVPYSPEEQKMRLSVIANVVIDACRANIELQPLHNAYAECKAERGIK